MNIDTLSDLSKEDQDAIKAVSGEKLSRLFGKMWDDADHSAYETALEGGGRPHGSDGPRPGPGGRRAGGAPGLFHQRQPPSDPADPDPVVAHLPACEPNISCPACRPYRLAAHVFIAANTVFPRSFRSSFPSLRKQDRSSKFPSPDCRPAPAPPPNAPVLSSVYRWTVHPPRRR